MKTYTVQEAALVCKCHAETIRIHIREGRLKASKPGRSYCIKEEDLEGLLEYLHNQLVQASLQKRSEQQCQSLSAMEYGIWTLERQAVKELDDLLVPKTSKKPRSYMTS
ncbi:excisionase family DNA-binding protein [Neisseriaceae bacterium CLB008]